MAREVDEGWMPFDLAQENTGCVSLRFSEELYQIIGGGYCP